MARSMFPVTEGSEEKGATLREWYAGQFMAAMLAQPQHAAPDDTELLPMGLKAVKAAEALIQALDTRKPRG